MAKKEFQFKGVKGDDIHKMSLEEITPLLKSRQRRTLSRGLKEHHKKLLKSVREHKGEKPIRTHARDMIIIPELIGKKLAIHNGKEWNIVEIRPEMIGHYLGEFSLTRKGVKHSGPGIGATRGTKFVSVK